MTRNLPAAVVSGNPRRRRLSVLAIAAVAATSAGCSLLRRPAPEPPAPPVAATYELGHTRVWTAYRDVILRGDSASVRVPRPFTALAVEEADSTWITVRCETCEGTPTGRVRHEEVVYDPQLPAGAASGSVAEFALAVRAAAERADIEALAPVMAADFTFSLVGLQGAERARAAWAAERYAILSRVPALLDGGLSPAGGGLWVAPAGFVETTSYRDLRIGFRRSAGGSWEWVFLVRGLGVSAR